MAIRNRGYRMKRLLWAALAALFTTAVHAKDICYIVTSDSLWIFEHELAHCNGWEHTADHSTATPPASYVHRYDGHLDVTMSDGDSGFLVGMDMQGGSTMHYSDIPAHELCIAMLTAYKYWIPPNMQSGQQRIGGCAVPTH
jgi:hypothetical protein